MAVLVDRLRGASSACVFGIGKLSDHAWVRGRAWLVVEFFRAVPVLLLMVFVFFAYGIGDDGIGSYWSRGDRPDALQRLGARRGLPGRHQRRAAGQAEAAYAIGMRKSQVMNIVLLPQAVKIMLPAIISQCVVALKDTSLGFYIARARPDRRRQGDLHRVPEPGADRASWSPRCTSSSTWC